MHSTKIGLCATCHNCSPGCKATHLCLKRHQHCPAFVQICQADGVRVPAGVVRNYRPNSDCLCFMEDCFHTFFLV